jgi:hypothetical protein
MYVLVQDNEHAIWKERWYVFMSRALLQVDLYMTRKDQVFVANVIVIDSTQETLASSVISPPVGAIVEFSTIAKIHKYRRLQKGLHFIPMAMEVHGAPEHDMDCFIREFVHLFHNRQSKGHLYLSFCIQFFKQHVSIVF